MKKTLKKLDYAKLSLWILGAGFLIRLILGQFAEIAGDACWHFNVARYMSRLIEIPIYEHLGRDFFWAPPLFHMILAFFMKFGLLFGDIGNRIVLMIQPIFGTLYLYLSYLLMKRYTNPKLTFYAILFLTFIPTHLFFSTIFYVDMAMALFSVLSIYFVLKNKIFLGGIFIGLAMLTKYNSIFVYPVLFFIIYQKSKKTFLKNSVLLGLTSFLIGGWWYIRNWILFENPVWPLANGIFNGIVVGTPHASKGGLLNLLGLPKQILVFIYSLFGLPQGDFSLLELLPFGQFNKVIIAIWIVAILFYFFPFFLGLFGKHKKLFDKVMIVLLLSFLFEQLLLIIELNNFHARKLMPAMICLAYFWSKGVQMSIKKFPKAKNLFLIFLISMSLLFVVTESMKSYISTSQWSDYDEDVNWFKVNTAEDDLVLTASASCLSTRIDRYVVLPSTELTYTSAAIVTKEYLSENVSYVHYIENQVLFEELPDEVINFIKSQELVYSNEKIESQIYRIR